MIIMKTVRWYNCMSRTTVKVENLQFRVDGSSWHTHSATRSSKLGSRVDLDQRTKLCSRKVPKEDLDPRLYRREAVYGVCDVTPRREQNSWAPIATVWYRASSGGTGPVKPASRNCSIYMAPRTDASRNHKAAPRIYLAASRNCSRPSFIDEQSRHATVLPKNSCMAQLSKASPFQKLTTAHSNDMTSMYSSYTAATFINSPHRGQEHQIVQITLRWPDQSPSSQSNRALKTSLSNQCLSGRSNRASKMPFLKPTGADKADQTELSGWPDQSSSSRSNRASKTSLQITWKPTKPIKPSLGGDQMIDSASFQANQTEL
ncbi:hypothetical protein JCGZ_18394 [Jatropha curcas]|uniref:Uncharacterized protein n=1 Tax=Jatropha curcas TaxID=180498 RepID=A0A067KDY4_JATCU|nr:hypothetical protein JCGZ_18394 [Jatropha curcas]